MQSFTSSIQWPCPKCEHWNDQEAEVPELDFSAEKTSDMAVDDVIEVICEGCDTEFYGHVFVGPGSATFELEEPVKFTIEGDMPMYGPDPDEFYPPADDPHSIASEALHQLLPMIGSPGPENDPQFLNRLILAGAVSSFEAYLGDTLINAVQHVSNVRTSLLGKNKLLGDETFSARELSQDPEAVTKRVLSKLRKFTFHRLHATVALYRDGFNIALIPTKEASDILFDAMAKRHDCVHRNGRDEEGKAQDIFTDCYVRSIIETIVETINYIEVEHRPNARELPF